MENRRPGWATVAGVGAVLVAIGLLVFLVSSFVPSPGFQAAAANWALTLGLLGIAVVVCGFAWRLLRVRQ